MHIGCKYSIYLGSKPDNLFCINEAVARGAKAGESVRDFHGGRYCGKAP